MYLFDTYVYIKQVLPPHWRDTWRETVLRALLYPTIEKVYKDIISYRDEVATNININAQLGVIQYYLNKKYAGGALYDVLTVRDIEIIDGANAGRAIVLIDSQYWDNRYAIVKDVQRVKPAGVHFTFEMK